MHVVASVQKTAGGDGDVAHVVSVEREIELQLDSLQRIYFEFIFRKSVPERIEIDFDIFIDLLLIHIFLNRCFARITIVLSRKNFSPRRVDDFY